MADKNPVSYDVDADNRFKKTMFKAIESGLDLSFSMGESVRIIKKESTKNFILKGSGKYTALNTEYQKFKQRLSPGVPILIGVRPIGGQSGKLKDSIIGTTADSIIQIGVRSLIVGTKAKSKNGAFYPVFVQDGTSKMDSRKFLFFSQAMVKQIMNTIDADINNQLPS